MLDCTLRVGSLADNLDLAFVLFEDLATTAPRFHPHPFTREFLDTYTQKLDIYDLLILREAKDEKSDVALAYGLLRGWDAGYTVPSLGLAVSSSRRGLGIGAMMMAYLHIVAKVRGAESVRLRVHDDNHVAIQLYASIGYVWQPDLEDGQLVGVYVL